MDWLKKFMTGRAGGDQLSLFLLILSLVLTLIGRLTGLSAIIMLSYIPLFFSIYRIFSRDVQKRRMENYRFSILISPIYSKFKKMQSRIKGSRTHLYFRCRKCKAMLRVPRGKGKILVTCPKCKEKAHKKT